MRINTNVGALNATRNLQMTQLASAKNMEKLSSGFRINRAADDSAGLTIANNLRNTTRSLTQASRNIEQANSLFQIAEGAAGSVESILERMKELATQAATDTNTTQLGTLDEEFQTLKSEIDRIVDGTSFQGTKLIDGSFSGKTLQVGSTNASTDQLSVTLGDLNSSAIGVGTSSLTSLANAQAAMASVDAAIGTASGVMSDIGSYQNRLEYAQTNVKTAIVNVSAAESVIRDVDMAEEMSKFSKNQILSQAGTSMLAQANQSSQGVLSLLR